MAKPGQLHAKCNSKKVVPGSTDFMQNTPIIKIFFSYTFLTVNKR